MSKDSGRQKTASEVWKEYYKTTHDHLLTNLGKLSAFQTRSNHNSWDVTTWKLLNDVVDVLNVVMEDLDSASANFEVLFQRVENLERQTGTFSSELKRYVPMLSHLQKFLEEREAEELEKAKYR